jgi:hypothetical protein
LEEDPNGPQAMYLFYLVEHEMEVLMCEYRKPDEPHRHWQFWNKSYKHYNKVKVIQENLELVRKRFIYLNDLYWKNDHMLDYICNKLRYFKNN